MAFQRRSHRSKRGVAGRRVALLLVVGRSAAGLVVDLLDRLASGWPLGRRPSVSTVNEITAGMPDSIAARVTPTVSSTWVIVIAVTKSAAVWAKVPIWVEWYSCAAGAPRSSAGV